MFLNKIERSAFVVMSRVNFVLIGFALFFLLMMLTDAVAEDTLTVNLPGVNGAPNDSIQIPLGRPIYALLVSGYSRNGSFDELHFYNFAKFLLERGAYVHYAWWNNILAPYLERPLHDSNSEPGDLLGTEAVGFAPAPNLDGLFPDKAIPEEDFQFKADAESLLSAIRFYNPYAAIIVVGHSMGGESVARLGARTNVDIDLLAPIDPVGNRSLPVGRKLQKEFNWTRWRATHKDFLGYKQSDCVRDGGISDLTCTNFGTVLKPEYRCRTISGWKLYPPEIEGYLPTYSTHCPEVFVHSPARRSFGSNIKYLYHRWQNESIFPFDFLKNERFIHPAPLASSIENGTNFQKSVVTCNNPLQSDPIDNTLKCNPADGHGEIAGLRNFVPLGIKARNWPNMTESDQREILLKRMADPDDQDFEMMHAPQNPDLCLVSPDLIEIAKLVVCTGDFDGDGDVDGVDTEAQAASSTGLSLEYFAQNLGMADCLPAN